MNEPIDEHQRLLHDYVLAIGGTEPTPDPDGHIDFDLHGRRARVRVKQGGSRIRCSVEVAQAEDVNSVAEWVETQPPPPTSELTVWNRGDGGGLLRFVWERTINESLAEYDPVGTEVASYFSAWRDGTDVSLDPGDFDPSDPRDVAPQQAWLVIGDEAAWPTAEELAEQAMVGDAGIFEPLWTAAKQTQAGDLLLFHFTGARRAVHFVARAASAAFYTSEIDVVTENQVRNQQWWVFHTPLVQIQPIPFALLRAASNDQLILRGRSGKFLTPTAIRDLEFLALDPTDQEDLNRIVVVPTGRADLPNAETMRWADVKQIAGGALRLESDVEKYIVEPLLRECLRETGLTYTPQYPIGRQRADFVVLDGDQPRCVVEVKLAINDSGAWARSPDLAQAVDYAAALGCPAVLIDTHRIALIDKGARAPRQIIERLTLSPGTMMNGNLYDLAEHLGVNLVHRSNGYSSWRERPKKWAKRQKTPVVRRRRSRLPPPPAPGH